MDKKLDEALRAARALVDDKFRAIGVTKHDKALGWRFHQENTMKFQLNIQCDNAAFEEDPTAEVARILRTLADRMTHASPDENYPLRDINGNYVGEAVFYPEARDRTQAG